jgi:DNA adenine methylase
MGYAGGKGRLWRSIVAMMPPHDIYIESHLGGGSVLRNKRPALRSIGVDIDREAIEAARGWTVPNLDLHEGDAAAFLAAYRFTGCELVYVDPPYLAETKGRRRYYRHEYSDEDHVALLAVLGQLKCRVMISGYPSQMYERALGNWESRDVVNVTHAGKRTERVWANFAFSSNLHDYDTIGGDFRERERVRRKAARWTQRLALLPELERKAVVAALLQAPEVEPQFIERLARQRRGTCT